MFHSIPARLLASTVTAFGLLTPTAFAQSDAKGNQTPQRFTRTVTLEQSLDYLLFLPENYDADTPEGWPLMLFLHGAGERGSNLERVKVHGPPKQAAGDPHFPFVLVSPQCPEDEVWNVAELAGLLDAVITTHNIDTNRIVLTGLSMGGYGSWSLGLAHPERFAAIAPICGGGEILSILLAPAAKREHLQTLPIWAFHGANDPVVPPEESQKMIHALKRAGARNATLTIYPDTDHDSWTATYANPEFYRWLLEQRRQP